MESREVFFFFFYVAQMCKILVFFLISKLVVHQQHPPRKSFGWIHGEGPELMLDQCRWVGP